MTYPGQDVTFADSSYLDPTKPNCIDVEAEYGTMWTNTTSKTTHGDAIINLYQVEDPFGIYDGVLSITTELLVQDEQGIDSLLI